MRKEETTRPPAVLACDPSLTEFGWVVCRGLHIVDSGCIKTKTKDKKLRIRKGDDRMRRISEINRTLLSVIQKHKVQYIVSELPHGSQSAAAAIALGMVSGAVQGMADFLELGIEWYSEGDSKMALLGKRSAEKKETIDAVLLLYKWKLPAHKYQQQAIADALSIHYAATQMSPVIKYMSSR